LHAALKGAVVGCRGIRHMHARAMASAAEIDLTAACDLDESLVRQFASRYPGVKVHTDLARRLEGKTPDIVALPDTRSRITVNTRAGGGRSLITPFERQGDSIVYADTFKETSGITSHHYLRPILDAWKP